MSAPQTGIVVRTLSDQTYELLRQRILTGDMGPGMPVRQDTIAEELGVSKIPLREALSRLEQDGLLNSYPNRGYVVRQLSAAEANEVFALRIKLEPGATAEAARKASAEEQEAAKQALEAFEDTIRNRAESDQITKNRAFHMSLIRPCGGEVTSNLLERLHVLAERYVRVHLQGRESRASQEHRELLDSWLARDAKKVEKLTQQHIQGTLADLKRQL
jgi:DNA-binding GntR family transcriptional regulator